MLLLVFLASSLASAGSSPATCFSACKLMNGSAGYRCETTYSEGVGGIMVVDQVAAPTEQEKHQLFELRDCFFTAGGGIFEIHWAQDPKRFLLCSRAGRAFACDKLPKRESFRNIKVKQ